MVCSRLSERDGVEGRWRVPRRLWVKCLLLCPVSVSGDTPLPSSGAGTTVTVVTRSSLDRSRGRPDATRTEEGDARGKGTTKEGPEVRREEKIPPPPPWIYPRTHDLKLDLEGRVRRTGTPARTGRARSQRGRRGRPDTPGLGGGRDRGGAEARVRRRSTSLLRPPLRHAPLRASPRRLRPLARTARPSRRTCGRREPRVSRAGRRSRRSSGSACQTLPARGPRPPRHRPRAPNPAALDLGPRPSDSRRTSPAGVHDPSVGPTWIPGSKCKWRTSESRPRLRGCPWGSGRVAGRSGDDGEVTGLVTEGGIGRTLWVKSILL